MSAPTAEESRALLEDMRWAEAIRPWAPITHLRAALDREDHVTRRLRMMLAEAMARAEKAEAERDALRAALGWYGEQARLCRLIHSGGDAGRHAIADDGGKRARAALAKGDTQ